MQNNMDSSIYGISGMPWMFDPAGYDYLRGKINGKNLDSENEQQVLDILKRLGFSEKQSGTFFYKRIIVELLDVLSEFSGVSSNPNSVKPLLQNEYSRFFHDIAHNGDFDVGLKTFHACIGCAYPNNLGENENARDMKISSNMNPMDAAWKIALYIANQKNLQDSQTEGKQPFANAAGTGAYTKK